VKSVTDEAGRITGYGYDPNGNQTTVSQPATGGGVLTATSTFDIANQLAGIDYSDPAAPDVAIAYDADGQRDTMTDGSGPLLGAAAPFVVAGLTGLSVGVDATFAYVDCSNDPHSEACAYSGVALGADVLSLGAAPAIRWMMKSGLSPEYLKVLSERLGASVFTTSQLLWLSALGLDSLPGMGSLNALSAGGGLALCGPNGVPV
jgi:RHS Repeat